VVTTVPRPPGYLGRFLALALLLGFYYTSYRYPLQINSTDTSPTYSDTPAWLALGKYLLLMGLLGWLVLRRMLAREEWRIRNLPALPAVAFLAAFPVAVGLMAREPRFVEVGFFFLPPLLLLFLGWERLRVEPLNRILDVTVVLAVVINAVQVILFFTVGRLPALAYQESISVRFGSFLDDPNGFGILLAWLLPFTWYRFRGAPRVVLVTLLVLSLVLTQSLTAVAAAVLVLVLFAALAALRRVEALGQLVAAAAVVAAVSAVILVRFGDTLGELYRTFTLTKTGSIEGHAEGLNYLWRLEPLQALGLQPQVGSFIESGYVFLAVSFGLPFVLVFLAVGAVAVWRYLQWFQEAEDAEVRAFTAGALGFLVAVYAGNVNLPLNNVFPINLFVGLLAGLALSGARLQEAEPHTEPPRAGAREAAVVPAA
jgi:hypothetical protein